MVCRNALSPHVEIYPREGTETSSGRPGMMPRMMVEIYPREGTETALVL